MQSGDRHRVPIDAIVSGLQGRIKQLCAELLPAGVDDGAEYSVGSLAGEAGQSCKIHVRPGPKAGVWCDFSTGEVGDALDLVRAVLFSNDRDKVNTIKWARQWLGFGGEGVSPEIQRRAVAQANARRAEAEREELRRRRRAQALYLGGAEIKGTPAADYLAGRKIDMAKIGHWPGSLKFVPRLDAWERREGQKDPVKVGAFPAMVASIVAPDGQQTAAHRTYLHPTDYAAGRKAPIKDAKKTFGTYVGGCIRLFKPILETGKRAPTLAAAPEGAMAAISEGIEDGMTYAMLDRSRYILAAVSLSNMGALWLPDTIRDVLIVGQNDDKQEAVDALDRAMQRFVAQGRTVRLFKPPSGFKDINDLVAGKRSPIPSAPNADIAAPARGDADLPVQPSPSAMLPADGGSFEGDRA